MLKKPEIRLAVLGMALLGSTVAWYLISPLFTSRQSYTIFPTLGLMASATPRPTATAAPLPTETLELSAVPAGAQLLATGSFVSVAYAGSGSAEVYELESGERVLTLENFAVTEGPELHVLLADVPVGGNIAAADLANSIDLGALVTTQGEVQIELPADLLLSDYQSIVIWCYPEQVSYMAAPLEHAVEQVSPTPDS